MFVILETRRSGKNIAVMDQAQIQDASSVMEAFLKRLGGVFASELYSSKFEQPQ